MTLLYKIKGIRFLALLISNRIFNLIYKRKLEVNVKIFGWPNISLSNNSKVKIGKNLVLISNSHFSEPGINHPVTLKTLKKGAVLTIGNNTGISGGGICCAEYIKIGNNVMFGANAFVADTDFHPVNSRNRRFSRNQIQTSPIVIEDNVFLGMNSIVLKGVKIGRNSIIAAGSVVTSDIPQNVIAGGIPAKVLKNI